MKTPYLIVLFLFLLSPAFSQKEVLEQSVNKDYPYLKAFYETCHSHPELSFYEFETAKRLAGELRKAGLEVTEKVGGTGVVGILKNGEGPTVLIRTDLDALPIEEETGLPYASSVQAKDPHGKEVHVMHACGHDVHMTVLLGTARFLATHRELWSGTLVFIGQPAEERGGGAKAMLEDGLYERFAVPDYAVALHVKANMPSGKLGYHTGYAMANVDMMNITVYGKGGHGAYPHTTVDPVVLAAELIVQLQTVVSRNVSPLESAVVTVGSIHGGTKGNVIPNEVKLELTLRSYTDETRNLIISRIEQICKGIGLSSGLPEEMWPKIEMADDFTPALYNDPDLAKRVIAAQKAILGDEQVEETPAVMGGEDFARYGRTEEKVPVFMFWLGAVDPAVYEEAQSKGETLPSLHSSKFAPLPEPTIKTGVKAMSAAVLSLAGKK